MLVVVVASFVTSFSGVPWIIGISTVFGVLTVFALTLWRAIRFTRLWRVWLCCCVWGSLLDGLRLGFPLPARLG